MKRVRFDPVHERRKRRRQSEAFRALADIVHDLSEAVQTLMSELPDLSGAGQLLVLVVALGGINGANTLATSTSTVPEHFSERTTKKIQCRS